ncbi:MAG: HEPN domain-containing protein [Bacteroides sp.]|nr:HEPN domain-containing protein [Bacteroides sp.]
MSLTEEERNIIVQLEYEKSRSLLEQAENIVQLGYWDMIANRLYYALFHAVSALLIKDHHKVGTHKGVVLLFGQHYIKTNKFSIEEGRLYSQLQTMREKADYNCSFQMTEKEILPLLSPAKCLIDKIGSML